MYSHVLLLDAQLDYEESIDWYLLRSIEITERFIDSINHTIKLICENPERWRNTYKNLYELSTKEFPFAIVYLINEKENLVIITSIYHHKRNPKNKFTD